MAKRRKIELTDESPLDVLAGVETEAAGETGAVADDFQELAEPVGDQFPVTAVTADTAEDEIYSDPRAVESLKIVAPLGLVPMDQVRAGKYHIGRHVELQLTMDQGIALRRLVLGLDLRGERLADGRRVAKAADAVRWLLEQLAIESAS